MTKTKKGLAGFTAAAAIVFCLLLAWAMPQAKAAGGLSGANIKDGQLIGYFGEGGDIVIPNTVTVIGPESFKDNDNVTSVTIPGSVQVIGYSAFEGCTALERIIFSDPVDGAELIIRVSAFIDCPKLRECQIPACAKYVTANVFKGCTSLEKIEVHPENKYYFTDDCGVLFGPWVSEGEPQYDDPNLALTAYPCGRTESSYTIPSTVHGKTVDRVWASGFRTAKNLTSIEIPSTCTIIGGNAFEETGLKNVTIPATVTQMGSGVFENCTDLTDVTFLNSVSELGSSFFDGCTSLQRVSFPSEVHSFGIYTFRNCTSLTSLVLPNSLSTLKVATFEGCSNLQRIVVPPSVTTFPTDDYYTPNPFDGCSNDLVIYVVKGSIAYKWAVQNADDLGISYVVVDSLADLSSIDTGEFYLMDTANKVKLTGSFPLTASLQVTRLTSGSAYDAFAAAADGKALLAYHVSLLPQDATAPDSMKIAFGLGTNFTKNAKLYQLVDGKAQPVSASFASRTLTANIEALGDFAVIDSTQTVDPGNTDPVSIELNKTNLTLEAGKKAQLSATVNPASAVDKSVTWSSSNDSVASVSGGVVTAHAAGTAIITAQTVNHLTAVCTVTVTGGTTPADDEISTAAALRSGTQRTADQKAPFSLLLKNAKRIATVQVTFTSDTNEVTVEGKGGFSLLGDVAFTEANGKYSGTAMLVFLTENQQTFSCTGETQIAQFLVSGEKPALAITGMTVSGWDDAKNVKFGSVTGIDPAEAVFSGEKNYDVNGDGVVDQLDITAAQLYYQATPQDSNWAEASLCDFNGDNKIDVADYIEIMLHFTR